MTTDSPGRKRPTVAEVRELQQDLAAAERRCGELELHAASAQSNLDAVVDARNRAENIDPEAKAYAACVAAIEQMHAAKAAAQRPSQGTFGSRVDYYRPETSHPHDCPEGRILLALAFRYGVSIQPTPTPEPEGPILVQAPRELADAIAALVEQHR